MAAPDPTRKTYIPPELLEMIFQHNSKTDLQNIRLACRQFDEVVVPLLYDELTLRLDVTEQEMAQRPVFTFGRYVKVLKFLLVCYSKLPFADYSKAIRKRCKSQKIVYDEHLAEESYERYNSLGQGHMFAITTGLIYAYVTSLIAHMPNLDCILVSDGVCRPPPAGLINHRLMNYACDPDHHEPYAVVPGSGLGPVSGRYYWNMLTRALSASETHFTKFIVDSSLDSGLRPDMWSIKGPQLERTLSFVSKLTTLQLFLDCRRSSLADRSALADVLAQATKLEALHLGQASLDNLELGEVLDRCEFPKLRICILDWFVSSGEYLLRFLSASKGLTHLGLCYMEFDDSTTWQEFVPKLKERLPLLEKIQLTDEYHFWVGDLIQDFFFRDGPNPFKDNDMDSDLEREWKKNRTTSTSKNDEDGENESDDEDSEGEIEFASEDHWMGISHHIWYAHEKSCDCSRCASTSKT